LRKNKGIFTKKSISLLFDVLRMRLQTVFPIQVIFSDETMTEVCPARSRRVWRPVSGPTTSRHLEMRTIYPIKVMLWGCMSCRGLGPWVVVRGTPNTEGYLDVLTHHLLPQAAIWYPSGDWTFQQDGARCRTSIRARQYFDDLEIPLLPWTANSPDLNPIEKKRGFIAQAPKLPINWLKTSILC